MSDDELTNEERANAEITRIRKEYECSVFEARRIYLRRKIQFLIDPQTGTNVEALGHAIEILADEVLGMLR